MTGTAIGVPRMDKSVVVSWPCARYVTFVVDLEREMELEQVAELNRRMAAVSGGRQHAERAAHWRRFGWG